MNDLIKIDGFDRALIATGRQCGRSEDLLIYSLYKMISILMEDDSMTWDEAVEYIEFNIFGSYIDENMPVVVDDIHGLEQFGE